MNFTIENNVLKSTEKYKDARYNLGQIIYDIFNENPDHVSQIEAETGRQITYQEMKKSSVSCASWMKKQGIGSDDIVVVCAEYQVDAYVPVLATFFLDAIFSGWSQNISLYTARRFLKQFAPKIIFSSEKAAGVLIEASRLENSNVKIIVFERFLNLQTLSDVLCDEKKAMDNFKPVNKKSSEDLAAIMLSSGSTGFPKGVMLSNKALVSRLLQPVFPPNVASKFIYYSTFAWISGLHFILQTIYSKYTRIIPVHVNIDNCFELIDKYEIDYITMLPTFVNSLSKLDHTRIQQTYNVKSLKFIYVSGCKNSKKNIEALKQTFTNAVVRQIYGMTEAFRLFQTNDKTENEESIGFISSYCQAKFVDLATGRSVGPNQQGEVCVNGPSIMIGYYKNIEATKESIDVDGWLRTGDIGYYNENGDVFLVGRIKEIIKYKGNQVSPAEVEEVLLSHPEVQEAAVVGIPHEVDGDWPAAFVEKTLEGKVTEKILMEYTSSILEHFKRLRGGIHFIDKLPRTASGKVAKNELQKLAKNLNKSRDFS